MRVFLLLLGLIPVLALGFDLYFKERAQERDARLVTTANRLLIDATAASSDARTVEIRRIGEVAPGIWQVQGHITQQRAGQEKRSAYSVEIEQRCANLKDDSCWRPSALVIGEETLLSEGPARGERLAPDAPAPEMTAKGMAPSDMTLTEAGNAASAIVVAPGADAQVEAAVVATTEAAAVQPMAPQPPAQDGSGQTIAAPAAQPAESGSSAAVSTVTTANDAGLPPSPSAAEPTVTEPAEDPAAAVETVEMSVEESLVWLIQDRLAMLGYGDPGSLRPSGVLDGATKGAIDAYQFAHGLPRDGLPSFELLDRLQAEAAQRRALAETEPGTTQPAGADAPTESLALPAPAVETAAPSWDTAGAAAIAGTLSPDLEQGIAPAAGDADSDETLPHAQGDAELEPVDRGPAAGPQQARAPEAANAAADAEEYDTEEAGAFDESLVFLIQDRLNRLGYDKPTPITRNGRLGSRTRLAIFDYQQKNRLPKDGRPTEALLHHLEETLLGRPAGAVSSSD